MTGQRDWLGRTNEPDSIEEIKKDHDEWRKQSQYPEYSPCNNYEDDLICPCCGGEEEALIVFNPFAPEIVP